MYMYIEFRDSMKTTMHLAAHKISMLPYFPIHSYDTVNVSFSQQSSGATGQAKGNARLLLQLICPPTTPY